ncbi:MAG: type VI secretion system-associated protein TagF [Roseibium sp.]|uniref:type VI secretion system-associated protein TagF n=1 Tax=Roseibium sp. TaxID=1936156 RepID=UPI002614B5E7|nr:type VI secretion system-associated protein TagF [Roseibium sp.]MCV0427063.1 type VI secretion system-associated protein TagF [Roseibium sp.]
MSGGYFGKLPARADFVSKHCPAGFLRVWEPFLIQGLTQSRLDLRDAWEEAYMTMPVWRFWMAFEATGSRHSKKLAGAFMPSIDKVGREFPLTVFVSASADEEGRPSENWFAALETVLLKTLDESETFDGFQKDVANLVTPVLTQPDLDDQIVCKPEDLDAMPDTEILLRSEFMCNAGKKRYGFTCSGLPHAEAFLWFLVPENRSCSTSTKGGVEKPRGRHFSEDHQA